MDEIIENDAPARRRRRGPRRVTVKEVAALAGVGAITVSRVLNQPESVSEALRERVGEAVRALGYVPNRLAGGLSSQGTRVVPVIVPSLSIQTFIEVIHGIQQTLEAAGYQMLLGTTDFDLEREAALIDTVLGYSPAGVIVTGLRHLDSTNRRLREFGRPVVEIMEYGVGCIDMNVGLSTPAVGAVVARHLVERGYRSIAFVGSNMVRDYRAELRYQGHRAVLEAAGLRGDLLIAYDGPSSYELGARALVEVLAHRPHIDAVHFANDNLAVGALLAANRQGIRVPQELAIAGYLGLSIGEHITPRLTTVVTPRYTMGRRAAEMLLARLRGESPVERVVDVGFELAVREST